MLHRPLHVVVRLRRRGTSRDERRRGVAEVGALREELVREVAERRDVAHVVLGEVELHPLANLPVELLVLLVEVRLLAVEVDRYLRSTFVTGHALTISGGALASIGDVRDLAHVDHLELVLRDGEADERAAVLGARRRCRTCRPSGFGVDTWVTVALSNQPGRSWPPSPPARIRKSFRTYWFSLKTPLREGRSATQPGAAAETPREGEHR